MKKFSVKAALVRALSFTVSFLLFVSVFTALASHIVSNVFLSSDKYIENCLTDKYFDAVYSAAEKSVLRATASVVTINEEKIKEVLDYDTLSAISREYTEGYIRLVFDGGEVPRIDEYECEEMRVLVRNTILESVEAVGGEISDEQLEADSTEAYELLAGYVDISVKIFPTIVEDAMVTASRVVSKLGIVEKIFPTAALAAVALAALKTVILRKKQLGVIAFNIVIPAWIATLVCVCPFVVLYYYDVASRLAVDSGTALYIILSGVVNTVIVGGLEIGVISFAVASLLLVITLVLSCFGLKKSTQKTEAVTEERKEALEKTEE